MQRFLPSWPRLILSCLNPRCYALHVRGHARTAFSMLIPTFLMGRGVHAQFPQRVGEISQLSFQQLSHHCFALMLLFSCRCISDFTCLLSEEPFCMLSVDSAALRFGPGLKQDCAEHHSPLYISLWRLMSVCVLSVISGHIYMRRGLCIQIWPCLSLLQPSMVQKHGQHFDSGLLVCYPARE